MRKSFCRFAAALLVLPAFAFQIVDPDLEKQARAELFAARYEHAAELYRKMLVQKPDGDGYYGLTRALLKSHRSAEAYSVAEEGLKRAPRSPRAQAAAGLAMFRKGDIVKAEEDLHASLAIDLNDCSAMNGLAVLYTSLSKRRTARDLSRKAYLACPDDPVLMLARANTLRGPEHIAALEQTLAAIDPQSDEARGLRAHIASDRTVGDRKIRRLVSAYAPARIKLTRIMTGPRLRGFGLRVQFNQRYTATLLLDTGASGISLAPKTAQKAGFELLSEESIEVKGIGNKKPQDSFTYLAPEIRIGDVVFADYPVQAFRAAKDSEIEGLIGADVFQRFIVSLNFPAFQIDLQPYPSEPEEEVQDGGALVEGFHRVLRAGNHLLIATSVNQSAAKWFLIDSGSFSNLIDTDAAREFTGVRQDAFTGVQGVQGRVDRVSRADRIALVFGGFRQENPNLIAISLENISDSMGIAITGVLGMPVLTQIKLTIDYRAGAVRFERST